ncbi:MAG: serine hydrolase [Chloroflexi bacterium]|nr:serine hydrolase [Chloroflexota bacterium]
MPAGTKWAYANHAFALVGEIIARIEGQPIEEVLQRRVFEPLNMADTDCYDQTHPELTTGYHHAPTHDDLDVMALLGKEPPGNSPVDGYNIRGKHVYVATRAAGAVQATIPDMAKYASALLQKSKGIVKSETFDLMTSPQWCPDERLLSLGLTFMRQERFGLRSFGHGGGIAGGWNTHIDVFPGEDLAVLTHINISFAKSDQIFSKIIQAVLDAPNPDLSRRPTDAAILKAAVGVYEPPAGFLTSFRITRGVGRIQITEKDGELELRARRGPWREGIRLVPTDSNDPAFFSLDTGAPEPPGLALTFDDNKAVSGINMSRMNLVRNNNLQPWVS